MGEIKTEIDSFLTPQISIENGLIFLKMNTYEDVLAFDESDYFLYSDQNNFVNQWDLEQIKEIKIDWDWIPSLSYKGVYIRPKAPSLPHTWYTLLQKKEIQQTDFDSIKNQTYEPLILVGRWQNSETYHYKPNDFYVIPQQVHQIFERSCSCHQTQHAQDQWYTLQVAHFPIISQEHAELSILQMFEPSRSILFLKLLADFPIQARTMPPAPNPLLSIDELWTIEKWILQGNIGL